MSQQQQAKDSNKPRAATIELLSIIWLPAGPIHSWPLSIDWTFFTSVPFKLGVCVRVLPLWFWHLTFWSISWGPVSFQKLYHSPRSHQTRGRVVQGLHTMWCSGMRRSQIALGWGWARVAHHAVFWNEEVTDCIGLGCARVAHRVVFWNEDTDCIGLGCASWM